MDTVRSCIRILVEFTTLWFPEVYRLSAMPGSVIIFPRADGQDGAEKSKIFPEDKGQDE